MTGRQFDIEYIKGFNDRHLVESTGFFVKEEREILAILLHHFREISQRRIYSDYRYRSLHEMLVQYYKYSDNQAYRRCSAMRLLYELPEIEEKICSGELNLTHMNLAQSLFRQEACFDKETKLEIIDQLCGKTKTEAQKVIFSLSSKPEMLSPDKITQVSEDKIEVKFIASNQLDEKIKILKGKLAHRHPNITLGELFEDLCDQALSAPVMKPRIKRAVLERAGRKCEICTSTYALEVDHIIPKAKGGSDKLENLRLLCRSCNQRAAIKHYGQPKMNRHLR